MRFENKCVVIASSGGSIGRAAAEMMEKEGAKAALLEKDQGQETFNDFSGMFCKVKDFASEEEMGELSKAVVEKLGTVDVIVTALFDKLSDPALSWDKIPDGEARRLVRNILTGTETVLKSFLPVLAEKESGRVVLLMTVAGRKNVPGTPWPEAMAYAGIGGLIRNGGTVFGKNSITFNGVAVGPVEGMDLPAYLEESVQGVWGRKATGADVANAIMYLSDEEAAWNTGEIVDLNGGYFAI